MRQDTIDISEQLAAQVEPLSPEARRRLAESVARAQRLQAEQLAKRGGVPFPSSAELLNELRDERSRQLA